MGILARSETLNALEGALNLSFFFSPTFLVSLRLCSTSSHLARNMETYLEQGLLANIRIHRCINDIKISLSLTWLLLLLLLL